MNDIDSLRKIRLLSVLGVLGVQSEFKARKGNTEWYGPCPIHSAKTNRTSFSFDESGKFHCFSCHAKGKGAIDLTMAVRKIGFSQAVEFLQSHMGNIIAQQATRPQIRQLQVNENKPVDERLAVINQPFKGTYEKYFVPSDWLTKRGLTPETLKLFGVGLYDNPKRQSAYKGSVLLKISRYGDGECVGYLSRNIGEVTPEKPKYSFPKGFHKQLEVFGAFQLKEKRPVRVLYLVESPFAVMAFHQKGFSAVSCFGWSVSDEQAEIIGDLAKGIVYLPDRDKYKEIGECVRKLADICWVKSPPLPDGISDPEQLSAEQIRALA